MDCNEAQKSSLIWRARDVPVSVRFSDPYFSKADGLAESACVFLRGNDLPQNFAPGFHIAELGFGTGLNMLAAWICWQASGQTGPLRFTSFEAYPLPPADMARALARWPEMAAGAEPLLALLQTGATRLRTDTLDFRLIIGDARVHVPRWQGEADAWFLDGFSPAKNPEMWGGELLRAVARHTSPGGSFATYTAAGHVRKALASAGFEVSRIPGFAAKRHMCRGVLV